VPVHIDFPRARPHLWGSGDDVIHRWGQLPGDERWITLAHPTWGQSSSVAWRSHGILPPPVRNSGGAPRCRASGLSAAALPGGDAAVACARPTDLVLAERSRARMWAAGVASRRPRRRRRDVRSHGQRRTGVLSFTATPRECHPQQRCASGRRVAVKPGTRECRRGGSDRVTPPAHGGPDVWRCGVQRAGTSHAGGLDAGCVDVWCAARRYVTRRWAGCGVCGCVVCCAPVRHTPVAWMRGVWMCGVQRAGTSHAGGVDAGCVEMRCGGRRNFTRGGGN
jgi:hypothetical protein